MAGAKSEFLQSLESVRGLAALTVCLFHASFIEHDGARVISEDAPVFVLFNGHGAVILFFVLSGFVLRLSIGRRLESSACDLSLHFLVNRLFRLFPVIITTVMVFGVVSWVGFGREISFGEIARNALLLETTVNGAFWTLQIEVIGSMVVLTAFLLERGYGVSAVIQSRRLRTSESKDTSNSLNRVWLWFRSPHFGLAAGMTRTSEPPHWLLERGTP